MTDESREVDIELALNEGKLIRGFELILEGLGIDRTADPHFRETPERAARAWFHELCSGLTQDPPKVTIFPDPNPAQLIIEQNIPVYSMCAHHLLPFYGYATVGYISGNHTMLGISKISRIVNHIARKPGVQETMTGEVAQTIYAEIGGPERDAREESEATIFNMYGDAGVGVVIKAKHMCMELRGVKHVGLLTTSAMLGCLKEEPETRSEFLRLAEI